MKRLYILLCILFVMVALFVCTGNAYSASEIQFNTVEMNEIHYVSLIDIADVFNIDLQYDPITFTARASRNNNHLTLTHNSQYAYLNDELIYLDVSPQVIRGATCIPLPYGLPVLSKLLPCELKWDESSSSINVPDNPFSVDDITLTALENGSLLRIHLAEPLDYKIDRSSHGWIRIEISGGNIDPDIIASAISSPLITDARTFQYSGIVCISFQTSSDVASFSVSDSSPPDVIELSLFKETQQLSYDYVSTSHDILQTPEINDQLWRIDTVIIDPGHGGKDPGAIGPNGAKEKDVVLKLAQELRKLIEAHGEIDVIMTRDSDTFVPLWERARIANSNHGKLFVSIHANAHRNRNAKGMEVYFLSAAKTEDAKEVARRENAVIQFEEDLAHYDMPTYSNSVLQNLMEIQLDMTSNVFLKESQDMCAILLDTAVTATRQQSRGVKQAGFQVMLETQSSMPSVLFEVGFISNPDEEKNLKRTSYQKRLAQAMYDSIILFKNRHEGGMFSRSE